MIIVLIPSLFDLKFDSLSNTCLYFIIGHLYFFECTFVQFFTAKLILVTFTIVAATNFITEAQVFSTSDFMLG